MGATGAARQSRCRCVEGVSRADRLRLATNRSAVFNVAGTRLLNTRRKSRSTKCANFCAPALVNYNPNICAQRACPSKSVPVLHGTPDRQTKLFQTSPSIVPARSARARQSSLRQLISFVDLAPRIAWLKFPHPEGLITFFNASP